MDANSPNHIFFNIAFHNLRNMFNINLPLIKIDTIFAIFMIQLGFKYQTFGYRTHSKSEHFEVQISNGKNPR